MAAKPKTPRFDRPCEYCGEMLYQVLARSTQCAACSSAVNQAYKRNRGQAFVTAMECARDYHHMTGQAVRDAGEVGVGEYLQRRLNARFAERDAAKQRRLAPVGSYEYDDPEEDSGAVAARERAINSQYNATNPQPLPVERGRTVQAVLAPETIASIEAARRGNEPIGQTIDRLIADRPPKQAE